MRYARQQLAVDREPAVELLRGPRHHAHGKLVLVHYDRGAERGPVRKQLEGEGGGDVVRDVGDAEVEEGQVGLEDVALEHLQLCLVRRPLEAPRQLEHLRPPTR